MKSCTRGNTHTQGVPAETCKKSYYVNFVLVDCYIANSTRHFLLISQFNYSSVPNRRAGQNRGAGGKFSGKSIIVQGENKRAGGN